jgi:hypothetical protein
MGQFKKQFAKARSALSEQTVRARRDFALKIVSCDQYETAKTLVRFHQQALINFSDELSRDSGYRDNSQLKASVTYFLREIEDLLHFLQTQYGDFFNFESRPSEFYTWIASQNLRSIRAKIDALSVDEGVRDLLQIVLASLEELTSSAADHCSYRVFNYSITFLSSLHEMILAHQCDSERLNRFLFAMNHNCEPFVENYVDQVQAQLGATESVVDQIELLAKCLKEVNQIQPRQHLSYNPQVRNVKDWLAHWLLEEIQYLETKRNLTSKSSLTEDAAIKKEFKMELDMSVSQLACLVKSFVDTGIIQNKNISELIRFLAKFVKTKRSENISYESFRMKYYNVESNTKDAVRNFFHTAIGRINST